MQSDFIKPIEAINRLFMRHYPGGKGTCPDGKPRSDFRIKAALIGALRCGLVAWRCDRWQELFESDSGATFGSTAYSSDEPEDGWPADFWQPSFAADAQCWGGNFFAANGSVSLRTAPNNVRRWLASNDEAHADWNRCADEVTLDWNDVAEFLGGSGWQSWVPKGGNSTARSPLAAHYKNALICMIARAGADPSILSTRQRIDAALFEEFDSGGATPDESEIRSLTRQIWNQVQPIHVPEAPN